MAESTKTFPRWHEALAAANAYSASALARRAIVRSSWIGERLTGFYVVIYDGSNPVRNLTQRDCDILGVAA